MANQVMQDKAGEPLLCVYWTETRMESNSTMRHLSGLVQLLEDYRSSAVMYYGNRHRDGRCVGNTE